MMKLLMSYTIIAVLTLYGCASSKVDKNSMTATMEDAYKKIATEKFGTNVQFVKSPGERFVMCVHDIKGTVKQPRNSLKYFVFDTKENKVVHEENLGSGTVDWFNETKVERFKTPGMIQKDQTMDDITTLYDVISKTSVTKSQFLKGETK